MGIGRGIWVVMAAAVLVGQTEPADPLALLKQQEKERAVNATQSSDIAAGLQRQLLGEMHGTNGAGAAAKRAPEVAERLTEEQVRGAMGKGAGYLLKRLEAEGTFAGIPPTEQRPWMGFAGDQQVGVAGLGGVCVYGGGEGDGGPEITGGVGGDAAAGELADQGADAADVFGGVAGVCAGEFAAGE